MKTVYLGLKSFLFIGPFRCGFVVSKLAFNCDVPSSNPARVPLVGK